MTVCETNIHFVSKMCDGSLHRYSLIGTARPLIRHLSVRLSDMRQAPVTERRFYRTLLLLQIFFSICRCFTVTVQIYREWWKEKVHQVRRAYFLIWRGEKLYHEKWFFMRTIFKVLLDFSNCYEFKWDWEIKTKLRRWIFTNLWKSRAFQWKQ